MIQREKNYKSIDLQADMNSFREDLSPLFVSGEICAQSKTTYTLTKKDLSTANIYKEESYK